jgi:ankyrin repeat protein
VVWRDDASSLRDAGDAALDRTFAGQRPLFYAARLRRLKTLQLLLEAGADATIADHRGRTPAAIARPRRLRATIIDRMETAERRAR